MVEYAIQLDSVFSSLADPTRRDILRRVAKEELSVGEIAKSYKFTFAAISKHLKVLEQAKLIVKRRRGKEQIVRAAPATLKSVAEYLKQYEAMWSERYRSRRRFPELLGKRFAAKETVNLKSS